MLTKILSAVLALTLTLAGAASAEVTALPGVVAFNPGVTYHYNYAMKNLTGMDSERDGTLTLRFNSNGIITGYYDPGLDGVTHIPVTGSIKGNSLWLDLGASTMHLLHVTATVGPNRALKGVASGSHSSNEYSFNATLAKH